MATGPGSDSVLAILRQVPTGSLDTGAVKPRTHPLAAEAGPVIFGDPDARFAELVAILVDAAGRLRAAAGEASG